MTSAADVVRPFAPRSGSGVGLITPSSSVQPFPRRTSRAIHQLEQLGFVARPAPHAFWAEDKKPSPRQLAEDLAWCCRQDDIDVVLCTTGGLTSHELLPFVDMELLAASRKPICGFSDITALLVGIHAKTGLVTFNGPTLLPSFGDADGISDYTAGSLLAALDPDVSERRLVPPDRTSTDSPYWDRDDDRPRISRQAGKWPA